jgi:hypothetical protein
MRKGNGEKGIGRRDFFKTVIGGAAALGVAGVFPGVPKMVQPARAAQPGNFGGCRLVVFGSDSLRFDYAQTLVNEGAPALSQLNAINPIICSLSTGLSVTQPGWTTIWTGMPTFYTKVYNNGDFGEMRRHMHIMRKLCNGYNDEDFFLVWITGKGKNVCANKRTLYKGTPEERAVRGPHWQVKQQIVDEGHPGVYHGDENRDNLEVFNLASAAIEQLHYHANFCCFIHFGDPDCTGHKTEDHDAYMDKALEVDNYIFDLMSDLPEDTNVIYCSDHGFDFKHKGDTDTGHRFSPRGMLATNFVTANHPVVDMCSVGRLLYRLAGGDPERTKFRKWNPEVILTHRMYGIDLI